VPIFQNFKEVLTFPVGKFTSPQSFDNEHCVFGNAGKELAVGAVARAMFNSWC
jgi:hypothetical protein